MSRCIHILILTVIVPLAGCGPRAGGNLEKEKLHLLHVVELASQYTTATKKQLTSIDDLKDWAIKEGKATEDDFISTRDKQQYGLATGMGVIVFEQTGKNGSCYIFQAGAFRQVPQAQVADIAKQQVRVMGAPRSRPGMKQK